MEIGKKLYVKDRKEWRSWLKKHYKTERDVWLVYYKKHTNKKRIPYNDAVEEALCFGWIDSIVKKVDDEIFVQRFSPRRKGSQLSEANRERIKRMIAKGRMTQAGLEAVNHAFKASETEPAIAPDILKALKADEETWKNFEAFPESYKRVRVGWVEMARARPKVFKTRLDYFIKKTAKNQRYGMVQ